MGFVAADQAEAVLASMRARPEGRDAVRIGTVGSVGKGRVTVRTAVGSRRVLDSLVGEQLPRIC